MKSTIVRLTCLNEATSIETENTRTDDDMSTVSNATTTDRSTPTRISFRLNPDGTRVSVSRPSLQINAQSPAVDLLRRVITSIKYMHCIHLIFFRST
jgi:hypothetical protein